MTELLKKFHERHERLKNYVHTAWRIPLPPWGQKLMGFVYFFIPVVGGYYTWLYVNQRSIENIGYNGSKLKNVDDNNSPPSSASISNAGGGVKLVQSTKETQQQNHHMLHAFLKQQQQQSKKEQPISKEKDQN